MCNSVWLGFRAPQNCQAERNHQRDECDGQKHERNLAHDGGRGGPGPLHKEHDDSAEQAEEGENTASRAQPTNGTGVGQRRGRPV